MINLKKFAFKVIWNYNQHRQLLIMQTRRSLTSQKGHSPIIIEYEEEKQKESTVIQSNLKIQKSKSVVVTKKRLTVEGWEPEKWRETWDLIREMRNENPAAVDTMGAHCLSDK